VADHIIQIADDFWNIRGSFRVGGVMDIGTQASLVKRNDGRMIMLDSYIPKGSALEQLKVITGNGALLDAVINLHPFHTVHCAEVAAMFPNAKHYGTARHHRLLPGIPWQNELVEDAACQDLFDDALEFSIPAGVDFIPENESLHFSSVLALHRSSRSIHVDDTLMAINMPTPLRLIGLEDRVEFHPTLAATLEKRAGAADDFQAWAEQLAADWGDAQNICAAHSKTKLDLAPGKAGKLIRGALGRVSPVLKLHKMRNG